MCHVCMTSLFLVFSLFVCFYIKLQLNTLYQCSLYKVLELWSILQNFTKWGEFLCQNVSFKTENWLRSTGKKAFFYTFSQNLLSQFSKVLNQFS